MSTIKPGNDADLSGFMARWDEAWRDEALTAGLGVIGLTNLGERAVPSARLAEALGRPVGEAEALVRRWGGCGGMRVKDGLVTINPERARSAARRYAQIGDRRLGVTGCGPDIFLYAPLVRPSLQLEETCTVTGTPIRILFTSRGVERVEPGGTVLALPRRQEVAEQMAVASEIDMEENDVVVCSQSPLFSSAEAAQGWLAAHPGGRIFPIREAGDLSVFRDYRERMSALLGLD